MKVHRWVGGLVGRTSRLGSLLLLGDRPSIVLLLFPIIRHFHITRKGRGACFLGRRNHSSFSSSCDRREAIFLSSVGSRSVRRRTGRRHGSYEWVGGWAVCVGVWVWVGGWVGGWKRRTCGIGCRRGSRSVSSSFGNHPRGEFEPTHICFLLVSSSSKVREEAVWWLGREWVGGWVGWVERMRRGVSLPSPACMHACGLGTAVFSSSI